MDKSCRWLLLLRTSVGRVYYSVCLCFNACMYVCVCVCACVGVHVRVFMCACVPVVTLLRDALVSLLLLLTDDDDQHGTAEEGQQGSHLVLM